MSQFYETEIQRLRSRGIDLEVVRTYDRIRQIGHDFVHGRGNTFIDFLLLCGPGGTGKSQTFIQAGLTGNTIKAAASAVGLYMAAYRLRDQPIVIDDIDGMLHERQTIAVLKSLTDTTKTRQMHWAKQNRGLAADGIPNFFETTSRVALIVNEIPKGTNGLAPLCGRGSTVMFVPTAQELHAYVSTWFSSKMILRHFEKHLDRIPFPHCRHYLNVEKQLKLGRDWQAYFEENVLQGADPKVQMLAKVAEVIGSFPARKDGSKREELWQRLTGQSRNSWYRWSREYRATHG